MVQILNNKVQDLQKQLGTQEDMQCSSKRVLIRIEPVRTRSRNESCI